MADETNGRAFYVERRVSVGSLLNLLVIVGGIIAYIVNVSAELKAHVDDVNALREEVRELRATVERGWR
jgi:hypothetical protein